MKLHRGMVIKALHVSGYTLYLLSVQAARVLPLPLVFISGKFVGALGYVLLRKRREITVRNMTMALGKSQSGARHLALQHFMNLGANLLSMLKIATMSDEQLRRCVTVKIAPEIPSGAESGIGWVAALSHMGNWELLGRLAQLFPQYRFGAVYQPLANDYVDRHFKKCRERAGLTLFNRREGFWKVLSFLESGGVLGVLTDQHAGLSGTPMPFFGREASTSTLAAALAERAGVAIVPISMKTTGLGRWHVSVGHPFPKTDFPEAATALINRELERQIAESPSDWLWSHNRWKLK